MPLPMPVLDNRTWTELTAEGRALIPNAAPKWTDHNAHDPGITLMELFAWLSEMLIFRLDRISPAKVRAFLRLAGVTPRPPLVSSTVIAFRADPGTAASILAAGTQVADDGGTTVFESSAPLIVSPAWIELSPAEMTSRGSVQSVSRGQTIDHSSENGGAGYWAFGADPAVGDCFMLGFDTLPVAPGDILSLHVWTTTWSSDGAARDAIEREWKDVVADCAPDGASIHSFGPSLPPAPPGHPPGPQPPPWWLHYSARTSWEYWAGPVGWLPVQVVEDLTRSQTRSGFGRRAGPAAHQPGPGDTKYWLRCRFASGRYDCPPRISAVAVNALLVRHAVNAGPENIGSSRGEAGQMYRLTRAPVVVGSTHVRLVSGTAHDDSWHEVTIWDGTGALDHHYHLDPATGKITFGDGRTGFVPADAAGVEMLAHQVGGGPLGNLPAGGLQQIVPPAPQTITVLQPFDATGGAAAESLDRAHGRALEELARPGRAGTAADFEALALETPGVPVARAAVWPGYHASYPCMESAGVVTVVVLPGCGSPPTPGPDFLAAIQAYIDRRRPLTTEVHIVGPTYVPVTVTATLHVARLRADLAAQAQEALDLFFDPLKGGHDGKGWRFGRAVIERELMAQLSSLPGVDFVDQLALTGADPTQMSCVNLSLCPTDLVASQKHRISVVEG